MGTLAAKNLTEALEQAKGVGIVEETFVIKGVTPERDCQVTVRNLRPSEYEAVLSDCKELDEMGYLNAFQVGHVSRSIVEINGVDLRDAEYIEEEEPDTKRQGHMRKVRVERHEWLRKNLLNSWSKEAISTVYRKVSDVVQKAEDQAKQGITFTIPDESPEEKFRRLLTEVREAEADVATPLVEQIYGEHDLMRKATSAELQSAQDRLEALRVEESKQAEAQEPEATQPEPATVPASVMRDRVPVHQRGDVAPPPVQSPPATQLAPTVPVRAQMPPGVDPQAIQVSPKAAAFLAQQEAELGIPVASITPGQVRPEPAEIVERQATRDPSSAAGILDQPPPSGINPRFRPPPR